MNEIEKYIQLYKDYYKSTDSKFGANLSRVHVQRIGALIQWAKAESLLDYGCGIGQQYTVHKIHQQWNVEMPTLYDPAITEFEQLPDEIFDGVICTDVLEHIPESGLVEIIDEIISKADKFIYFHISTRLANTILPNGENAHCTVYPHKWWVRLIQERKEHTGSACKIYVSSQKGWKSNSITQTII